MGPQWKARRGFRCPFHLLHAHFSQKYPAINTTVLRQLELEREHLAEAIAALERISRRGPGRPCGSGRRRGQAPKPARRPPSAARRVPIAAARKRGKKNRAARLRQYRKRRKRQGRRKQASNRASHPGLVHSPQPARPPGAASSNLSRPLGADGQLPWAQAGARAATGLNLLGTQLTN